MRRVSTIVITLPLVLGLTPAASAATMPPIEHLVVIVEQNSTFDHTFGTLPAYDLDGIGANAKPSEEQAGAKGIRMIPFNELSPVDFEVERGDEILSNGPAAALAAFDGGAMDGFYKAQRSSGKNPEISFSVLDRHTPSPWRRLVGQSVVFDRYFSSSLGGSLPNTLNLVAGQSGDFTDSSRESLERLWRSDIPTIFDAAAGTPDVSWRYYVGGLDGLDEQKIADGYYARSPKAAPSQLYWAPILSMKRFWDDPTLSGNIRTQNDFFHDAAAGSLPNITYLLPQPTSHEPLVLSPDLRLMSIVNALRTSPDWSSTAVLIVWDDWGGYYDHVAPPQIDGQQLGFRVPMMLLSPYATPGVWSGEMDHSSIPRFAASLFGLPFGGGRTHVPLKIWSETPVTSDRIVALSHPDHYQAAGMEHAPSVFILYLLTIVMITGVLFVVGVTLRNAPPQGGTVP